MYLFSYQWMKLIILFFQSLLIMPFDSLSHFELFLWTPSNLSVFLCYWSNQNWMALWCSSSELHKEGYHPCVPECDISLSCNKTKISGKLCQTMVDLGATLFILNPTHSRTCRWDPRKTGRSQQRIPPRVNYPGSI